MNFIVNKSIFSFLYIIFHHLTPKIHSFALKKKQFYLAKDCCLNCFSIQQQPKQKKKQFLFSIKTHKTEIFSFITFIFIIMSVDIIEIKTIKKNKFLCLKQWKKDKILRIR